MSRGSSGFGLRATGTQEMNAFAPKAREKNTILNVLEGQIWGFCAPQAREKIRFWAFYKGKNGCLPAAGAKIFGVPSRKMDDPPLCFTDPDLEGGGSSRMISPDVEIT